MQCLLSGERSVYEVAVEKHSRFGLPRNRNIAILAMVVVLAVVALIAVMLWARNDSPKAAEVKNEYNRTVFNALCANFRVAPSSEIEDYDVLLDEGEFFEGTICDLNRKASSAT